MGQRLEEAQGKSCPTRDGPRFLGREAKDTGNRRGSTSWTSRKLKDSGHQHVASTGCKGHPQAGRKRGPRACLLRGECLAFTENAKDATGTRNQVKTRPRRPTDISPKKTSPAASKRLKRRPTSVTSQAMPIKPPRDGLAPVRRLPATVNTAGATQLARACGNRDSALLVEHGAAAVENSVEVPQKIKNRTSKRAPAIPFWFRPKGTAIRVLGTQR